MLTVDKPDKSKLVRNYLTKNIEIRPILKEYRKSLDKRFQDFKSPSGGDDDTRENNTAS